jgi:dolichol-phosphate mannosyltransferase
VPPLPCGNFPVKLSVVVPTYNEGRNIHELLEALQAVLAAEMGNSYEIIVVDDDSPDGTWKIAGEIARRDARVKVLRRKGERGLAMAVVRGWQVAHGDILGVIDGDLQHPPTVIGELWPVMAQGVELAVASRWVEGGGVGRWNFWRRMTSRGARWIGAALVPGVGRVSDPMSGCFLVRRSVVEGIELRPRGFKILLEVLGRARPSRVAEVGYVFGPRQNGASKATLRVFGDYLLHLLRLRWTSSAGSQWSASRLPQVKSRSASAGHGGG